MPSSIRYSPKNEAAAVAICSVCGTPVLNILLCKNGWNVVQCGACGLAFTHPQPQSTAEQYDADYFKLYAKRREFRLRRAAARLRRIEVIIEPGKLLDIGCSLGYFIEAAAARGWQAMGIEISPYAADQARSAGLDVRTGTLEDAAFPSESFDCVTMWDVLEHVTDPTKHMLEVHRILRDGGLVVIGTPDIGHLLFRLKRQRWRHLKPTEHLFYFRRSSIKTLLEKTGFRPFFGGGMLRRFTQLNDVMTVYGVKDGIQIPVG